MRMPLCSGHPSALLFSDSIFQIFECLYLTQIFGEATLILQIAKSWAIRLSEAANCLCLHDGTLSNSS